jgi:hypothetical protein
MSILWNFLDYVPLEQVWEEIDIFDHVPAPRQGRYTSAIA